MPELPEVETTRLGLEPHIVGRRIQEIEIRERRLRWPVSEEIYDLAGQQIISLSRRAKYLLFEFTHGHIIGHLGMSGSMRLVPPQTPWRKHDHIGITLKNDQQIRYHDPRRFGCMLWTEDIATHPLLKKLGPEPLSEAFDSHYLFQKCKHRGTTIKQHIMNASIVVGVGNIYASEALFSSGISPKRKASQISQKRLNVLCQSIKDVLQRSIDQGGTTLRDFLDPEGSAGYFKQKLNVYDRDGEECRHCGNTIKKITLGQRSTFFCNKCQT